MQISPVTNLNTNNNLARTNKNLAFNAYKEKLYLAVRTEVKDTKTAERLFCNLFDDVCQEPYTHRNPIFEAISEVYKKGGLKGLLEELRQPKDESIIKNMLDKSKENFIQIVTQHGQPLFELFHFGKFGSAKNAPNDVKVIFRNQNQKENIEFSLGKNLNLNVGTTDGCRTIDTEFYSTTGTPKVIVENCGGSQERTFFNEDGSKPFWKNFFRGGVVTSVG